MVFFAPDYMAPSFAIFVEGNELREDVTEDIIGVTYEHTANVANLLSVTVNNDSHKYTDNVVWSPGNEVEIHLGYGTQVDFVGRGEIIRHLPTFPGDSAPVLMIKAYDRSWRMMQQELEITGGASKRPKKKKPESGIKWEGQISAIVGDLAEKYGMVADIDPDLGVIEPKPFLQEKGTSDYKILRSLANLYGADFRVEYEPSGSAFFPGEWKVRFLKPGKAEQSDVYTFVYAQGDDSTILSVDLEFGMPQTPSELQVWVFDRATKDWIVVSEEETEEDEPQEFSPATFVPGIPNDAPEIESMTKFRLGVGGHAIEVMQRKFPDAATAAQALKVWFQQRKDHFVIARARLPGITSLRSGQTHRFEGLGNRYTGDYFFSKVLHKWDSEAGYTVEVVANKVLS
jgi:phage protein D